MFAVTYKKDGERLRTKKTTFFDVDCKNSSGAIDVRDTYNLYVPELTVIEKKTIVQ